MKISQKLRDVMRRAKKEGRRAKEVVPVVWEWVDRLWQKGEGDERVVAVMVGLAMRLMLRPGEWGRIRGG